MRNKIFPFSKMGKTTDDLGRLPLGSGTVTKASFEDPDYKCERRGIKIVSELNLDERIQGIVRVFGRVAQGLQQNSNSALNFWIADDLSKSLQATVSRCPHFL